MYLLSDDHKLRQDLLGLGDFGAECYDCVQCGLNRSLNPRYSTVRNNDFLDFRLDLTVSYTRRFSSKEDVA